MAFERRENVNFNQPFYQFSIQHGLTNENRGRQDYIQRTVLTQPSYPISCDNRLGNDERRKYDNNLFERRNDNYDNGQRQIWNHSPGSPRWSDEYIKAKQQIRTVAPDFYTRRNDEQDTTQQQGWKDAPGPSRRERSQDSRFNPISPSSPLELKRLAKNSYNYLRGLNVNENILKKWPPTLLIKFQPSLCSLCNFAMDCKRIAKMHYNSKNHAKLVEKWELEKTAILEISSNKELFIEGVEPRHVCCTLCDIIFTSKSHMDMHYSGRNHWSIVDGKRVPKNSEIHTNLLAKLIEREQRYRPTEKIVTLQNAKAAATARAAAFYCTTCNIRTTNEEQLINHKNGKKHLQRETKQILKFCNEDK